MRKNPALEADSFSSRSRGQRWIANKHTKFPLLGSGNVLPAPRGGQGPGKGPGIRLPPAASSRPGSRGGSGGTWSHLGVGNKTPEWGKTTPGWGKTPPLCSDEGLKNPKAW